MIMRADTQKAKQVDAEHLQKEFDALGLDPTEMLGCPLKKLVGDHADPWELLRWAKAYRACPDRKKLQSMGFYFPPVADDIDPETDWLRFECWMRGKPVSWSFLREFGDLRLDEEMDDVAVSAELKRVTDLLAQRSVYVDIPEAVPERSVYRYLRSELLDSTFEYLASGAMCIINGCGGWCPDCFQRPWCQIAAEMEQEEQNPVADLR